MIETKIFRPAFNLECEVETYLQVVKESLKCDPLVRSRVIELLRKDMHNYIKQHPGISMQAVCVHFGDPYEVGLATVRKLEQAYIKKLKLHIVLEGILIGILAFLLLLAVQALVHYFFITDQEIEVSNAYTLALDGMKVSRA